MKKLICERANEIIRNKELLEETLNIKIANRGKEFTIDGLPLEEYEAEKVLDAINFGFKTETALLIKENELAFEVLNIKKFTTKINLSSVRARIIGTKGKTMKTLMELTGSFIEIRDNDIGIIGEPEKMKIMLTAITNLIRGSKQANIYAYLEKHRIHPVIDLGLKEVKKRKPKKKE